MAIAAADIAPSGEPGAVGKGSAPVSPLFDELVDTEERIMRSTPGIGKTPCFTFATTLCKTLDENGNVSPIPAWDLVREDCEALEAERDIHDEKSRQMLATHLTAAQHLFRTIMVPKSSGFITSRKEKLVDDGGEHSTPFSIMGRIRFMYENLPPQLREDFPVEFTKLKITCERTKSFVVGEGASGEVARGGTFGLGDADEAAFIEGDTWYRAMRSACRILRMRSTPNGKNNRFAQTKFEIPGDFLFLRKHWTRNPNRWDGQELDGQGNPTSAWYRRQCASMTKDEIAREIDISYEHSVSGQVWPEYDEDLHVCDPGVCVYEASLPLYGAMDFGGGAATTCVFFQVHGREMWILGDYESWNGDVDDHAPSIWAKAVSLGFRGEKKEIRMYGDPAGNAKELTNKNSTVIRAYRNHGFTNFSGAPRRLVKDSIRQVRRKFKRNEIHLDPGCRHIRRRITDYRYRTDDMGNVLGDVIQENASTHMMDAIRYGCLAAFAIDEYDTRPAIEIDAPRQPTPIPFQPEGDRTPKPVGNPFASVMSGRPRDLQ